VYQPSGHSHQPSHFPSHQNQLRGQLRVSRARTRGRRRPPQQSPHLLARNDARAGRSRGARLHHCPSLQPRRQILGRGRQRQEHQVLCRRRSGRGCAALRERDQRRVAAPCWQDHGSELVTRFAAFGVRWG